MERTLRAWLPWSAAGLALAAAGALVPWYALSAWFGASADTTPCLFHAVTGMACPTCGLTRALAALAHGDLRGAWTLHPWAVLLAAQVASAWLAWGAWLGGRLRRRPDHWVPHAAAANAVLLLLIWVARLVTGALPG